MSEPATREKTIDGIRYQLVTIAGSSEGLIVTWPDGYVQVEQSYISQDGYDTGSCVALYEDEPMLVESFAMHRADDPKSFADGG